MSDENIAAEQVLELLKIRDASGRDALTKEENVRVDNFLYQENNLVTRLDLHEIPITNCFRSSYIKILQDRIDGKEIPSDIYSEDSVEGRLLL